MVTFVRLEPAQALSSQCPNDNNNNKQIPGNKDLLNTDLIPLKNQKPT